MPARSTTASTCTALVAVLLSALGAAGPAAAAAEVPFGAMALPTASEGEVGTIGSVTEPDRYVLEGYDNPPYEGQSQKLLPLPEDARPGDTNVRISAIEAPAPCTAPQPLQVGLYNPEGRFIRGIEPRDDGAYEILVPRVPGLYSLTLSVADPACAGLRYTISAGVLLGSGYNPDANRCDVLNSAVRRARRLLRDMRGKERAARKGAPRQRIHKLVVARDKALKRAQADFAKARGC